MRLAFIRGHDVWGGDLKAISDIQKGLVEFGVDSFLTGDCTEALRADLPFFLGTCPDHRPNHHLMRLLGREYGCIAFHGDSQREPACYGFLHAISHVLEGSLRLEDLIESPKLIYSYAADFRIQPFLNGEFLREAKIVIANSHTEQRTLLRDASGCRAQVVYWAPGHAGELSQEPSDAFLSFAGVEKKGYILQIGRLCLRKNQLGALLAVKDLDIPLVFIAATDSQPLYEKIFFEAALRWRKAPTILVSQFLSESDSKGPLKVIPSPEGQILAKELILSAIAHAGLYLHPAFSELPGYTCLEAARFGIPTVASQWSSLKDYFHEKPLDARIEYVLPYDLTSIGKVVERKFGEKFPETPLHPIFQRTSHDVARDFLRSIRSNA